MEPSQSLQALYKIKSQLDEFPVAMGSLDFPVDSGVAELHGLEDYLSSHLPKDTKISLGRVAFNNGPDTTISFVVDSRPSIN